ncbi:hypothetical protein [Hymenobacter cavernae]|uniref:Uncharacterized protein n=1 Tax=Hymenobacter cavernae TaxID=2044852 RepID=A0ABQ1TY01_9BACT|nr:hypothetical protein [Hymenobacter cavernae]GGF06446.1 hypothetical protein GCM10011383_16880 [Hymenobacter cavernae]
MNYLFSVCLRFLNACGIGVASPAAPAPGPEETFLTNATLLVSYAQQELQQFRAWTPPTTTHAEHARSLQRQLKQVQQELKLLQEEYRADQQQQQQRTTSERQHPATTAVLEGLNSRYAK